MTREEDAARTIAAAARIIAAFIGRLADAILKGTHPDLVARLDASQRCEDRFCGPTSPSGVSADPQDSSERLHAEWLAFTAALGFGDDVQERAAMPSEVQEFIEQALADSREHQECPIICEPCGERLADTACEHCHGSGCGPGTASGAYEECEWCAGAGKVHEGCAEMTYADLKRERDALAEKMQQVRGRIASRLEAAWDDGNAEGLDDGWVVPERDEALAAIDAVLHRDRFVDRMLDEVFLRGDDRD